MLVLVAIGIGLYLAASGGSGEKTRLLGTPVVTGVSSVAASVPTSAPAAPSVAHLTHSSPPTAAAVTHTVTSTAPAAHASISDATERHRVADTIERHFTLISQHEFSAAYALLAPSLQTGESSWVSAHKEDGIYKVDVAVNASLHSSDSATATIDKMTTLDGHGCKTWSGSWDLTKLDGQWRISKANVDPVPC